MRRVILGGLFVIGTVLMSLFLLQRGLIYHPHRAPVAMPPAQLYPGLRDVNITTEDGVALCAWYWPAESERPAVLFLHGNAGDRSYRLDILRGLHARGYTVLSLDYRGYGGSAGMPSEDGLYLDAEAAATWLKRNGHDQLLYFGESLGTGVAVELARRSPPAALILEAPFDSLTEVAGYHFPWLPVRWMLRDRFDSAAKIGRIEAPLLIIHGDEDRVVPQARGRALFEAAAEPKTWIPIPGAGHNDLRARLGDAYFERLDAFIRAETSPTRRPEAD